METFLFFICLSLITSSFYVINLTNPVHSALFLVCAFLNSALILFLLGADFLGFVFILVYIGAIAIFLLLVIMMLNIKADPASLHFLKYGPLSFFICFIFIFEFLTPFISDTTLINFQPFSTKFYWATIRTIELSENCQIFGQLLYTHYFIFFLMVGLILLVALFGSMMLTVSSCNRKICN